MDFFISVLIPVFWLVIIVGIVLAIIRGVRKRRLKTELNPIAGAADAYNEALIGKTGISELNETFKSKDSN